MAIRIRKVSKEKIKGETIYSYIALCAAEHKSQKGDIYLNDAIHHALTNKFEEDFDKMGFLKYNK
jgi:hypothetical protein